MLRLSTALSYKSICIMPDCQVYKAKMIQRFGFIVIYSGVLLGVAAAQSIADREAIAAALRRSDFASALQLLQSTLKKSPNDVELLTMRGVTYERQGNQEQALPSFQKALQISPNYIPALEGAIQILYQHGSPKATPLLERMLRMKPADATSHGMLAVLEYQQGNCSASVVHFEKAGSLFDAQPDALHAYATCLVKLQQFEKAAAVFQRTLAMSSNDPRERELLASVQVIAHQPKDAITTLQPLTNAPNPSPETLELVANAYEDAGDTEKAVAKLRQAILLDPQNVGLYLDFAQISEAHQSFQVGINVVSDGITQQPAAAQLYFARGVLYVQIADYDKAEADLAKAYELAPNESLTAAAQGLLAVQQNDLDRAMRDVKEKLKSKPNDPVLLYLQADVLTQKGAEPGTPDFQLAIQSAKKAVLLRPTLAAARAVLAKLYIDSGNNREAAEQCRKALEIDPKDQTSLYRLIQALRKTRDTEQVPELLKRLALLRQESAKQQKQRSRFTLIEGDAQP
jgi:tetratricopeptide (TPR) repeat protein